MPATPLLADDLVVERVDVIPSDVVYLKGLLEASEGIACVFAERGGELLIAAPPSRARALAEILDDVADEIDLRRAPPSTTTTTSS